jgi:hypothetical protein
VTVDLSEGDFVLVEFALRPAPGWTPEAGAMVMPPVEQVPVMPTAEPMEPLEPVEAVPTEVPAWTWQGIEYERRPGADTGDIAGVLAVRVVGVPDRKVFVEAESGTWETTLVTGRKPEYGDFSDSVGGLSAGRYTVKPMDIDSQVTVDLAEGDFVLVEFALRPAPGWTPQPQGGAPDVAGTDEPMGPQVAAGLPKPTLVPGWTWLGREADRQTGKPAAVLVVRAVALPDWQVLVSEMSGSWETTLATERHPEYGNFSAVMEGLSPGTYAVKLADIDSEIQVELGQGELVLVEYFPQPLSEVPLSLEDQAALDDEASMAE